MSDTNKKCLVFCSAMNMYLGLSLGLSIYNKYILQLHKFPLFLLTCQFFFLFCISGALIYTLLKPKLSKTPYWITKMSYSMYFWKLLPIGFLYGFDFILTNVAIASGPLAFVQMIKAGVPLIVLFFKLIDRDAESIDSSVILSMTMLCCGQLLIYIHEVEFDWICFIASLGALVVSGIKLHVIEKLLKHTKTVESSPIDQHHWNENDITSEGEHSKLNTQYGEDDTNNEETSAFIGIDSFSPAELILTDSEDAPYNKESKQSYKEDVQLQMVETNKKRRVTLIKHHGNGTIKNKKDRNFFEAILNKLSLDNIHESGSDHEESDAYDYMRERNKVLTLTQDIPLNEEQKRQQTRFSLHMTSNTKPMKQKMHSMLALFYFMPISWLTATVAFIVFEYPYIETDSVFADPTEMISLLFEYLLSAIIAFALNWCELFMLGRWNALSFCIFGVLKLICIVGASWIIFEHSFTLYSLCGYALCIVAVLCYNWSQIKNKSKVKKDLKQIYKACYKSLHKMECFKRNQRRLYTKIWSEFPQNDGTERSSMYDYDSESSSDQGVYR